MAEPTYIRRSMWDVKESKEKPERCIRRVASPGGWHFFQCQRKRGHGPDGLFCKQHAKMVEQEQQ